MYRMDRKRTLVWIAVVVLLGYAFFNFYSENTAQQTTAELSLVEQLAQRISTLETQVAQLEAAVAAVEEQVRAVTAESSTTQPALPTTAVVTVQYLNVRAEPSTEALRVGVLTKNAEVTVLAQEGEWSKIHFEKGTTKLTGWVASRYIAIKDE